MITLVCLWVAVAIAIANAAALASAVSERNALRRDLAIVDAARWRAVDELDALREAQFWCDDDDDEGEACPECVAREAAMAAAP